MTHEIRPLKNESLAGMAVKAIREAIFTGRFAPGDPLREQALAKEFGISQNTIREALLELQNLGLVRRLRNRATYVTELSAEDVRKRLAVRIPLEQIACIEAAARLNCSNIAAFENALDALSEATRANDYAGAVIADLKFHRLIWSVSANDILSGMLDQVTAPLFAFFGLKHQRQMADLAEVVDSHRPILEAMESGDADRIRQTIRHHIEISYPTAAAAATVETKR